MKATRAMKTSKDLKVSKKLEKKLFAILMTLSDEMLHPDNVTLEWVSDYFETSVRAVIKAYIWSEDAGTYTHPINWFEAFKEEHYPTWLKKRYPVKFREVHFSCIYPKWTPEIKETPFNIVIEKDNRHD